MDTVASRIKESLELRQMKQADLAEITGISKSVLSNYIFGRYVPKPENVTKIANALNVDEVWLIGNGVPSKPSNKDYVQPKIKHILRDGTVLDTMEGFVLPVNEDTKAVYQILADIAKRQMKNRTAS